MSDPVVANIIKTGAIMWYAPLGEALPSESTVGYGDDWAGNWERVGFTNAPLTLLYEDTRHTTRIEEMIGPIKDWRISEDASFETVLAEIDTDYIGLLVDQATVATAGGPAQKAFDSLAVGGNGLVTQYAVGVEGFRFDTEATPVQQPVRIFFTIASFAPNGPIEFSNVADSYPNVPIKVKGFADTANSGQVITWQIVTGPVVPQRFFIKFYKKKGGVGRNPTPPFLSK